MARVGDARVAAPDHPAQQAFLAAVSEAFGIELDPADAEQTLARLGSIARMVGATMSQHGKPDDAAGRLQAQRDSRPGDRRTSTAGSCPGGREELLDTITELLGDRVRYEIADARTSRLETKFGGALVEAMQACAARRRIRAPARCPI